MGRWILATGVALSLAAADQPTAAAATQRCAVTVQMDGAAPLGALELRVHYSGAVGEFLGEDGAVSCVGLAPAAYQSARDDDAARQLHLGMISAIGVALPQDSWRCIFETDAGVPVAGDFSFTVDDALDPELVPVEATPSIGSIACESQGTCGNGTTELGEECDDAGASAACDAGCSLTRDSQSCELGFRVTGPGPIGGVQFRVDYSGAGGEFEGEGVDVACSDTTQSALTAAEDRDAEDELRLAMVSASGIALPADLWQCTFVTGGAPLQLQDFQFSNVIATNHKLANVAVTVAAISGPCIYGPYCGDGTVDPGEACDDGNTVGTDACTNACKAAACGDGIVRSGVEQCDDGNTTAGDCCAANCSFEGSAVSCNDGIFCNGADSCSGGSCSLHAGNPCPGADGDIDCSETCSETSDACSANDPNGSDCNDGSGSSVGDLCQSGICIGGSGDAECGDADGNGSITASDALRTLRKAVGQNTSCPLYLCDTDSNGSVQTSDALRVLRKSVGQTVVMNCPANPA